MTAPQLELLNFSSRDRPSDSWHSKDNEKRDGESRHKKQVKRARAITSVHGNPAPSIFDSQEASEAVDKEHGNTKIKAAVIRGPSNSRKSLNSLQSNSMGDSDGQHRSAGDDMGPAIPPRHSIPEGKEPMGKHYSKSNSGQESTLVTEMP